MSFWKRFLARNPEKEVASLFQQAVQLYQQGRFEEALPISKEVCNLALQAYGERHSDFGASLNFLATLYRSMGHYADAEPLYRQALDIARRVLGEGHPNYAAGLYNLAGLYQMMGNYPAAEPLYRQALDIRRKVPGEDHPDYANSLNGLAMLYYLMGNYAAAEPLYRQALEILGKAMREDHPDYATILNNLAVLSRDIGHFASAESLLRQALEIRRKILPENHPDIAQSLNNLAELYRAMGNYTAAEPLYRQALDIRHKALPEHHPDIAQSLNNLAELYRAMGNYTAAEPLYRQALDIRRKALSEEHPDYAASLETLAMLYQVMGRYAAAEPLYKQVLDMQRKVPGADHPTYANSLNNLATLYQVMGHYAAAEPLYKQVLDIQRKVPGEDHPDFANTLNNLAMLYESMGNYPTAESHCRQALEIRRKAFGENHPGYAASLNNLAMLYQLMGHYDDAVPRYKQALDIQRSLAGEDHPDYAASLNNLATLYKSMGKFVAAEPLCRQALEIQRKVFGEEHPAYATGLNNLAALYESMGKYLAAEPLCRQALEIQRKALDQSHLDRAASLSSLAILYVPTDRAAEALPLMQEAAAIDDRMIGQVFSIGSESQRLEHLATLRGKLYVFLSLVFQHLFHSSEAVQSALELVLRRKAIGAEALAAQRDAVLGGLYPALQPKLQQLMTWRRQIAQKTLAGPGPEGPEAYRKLIGEWTAQKERLEQELVHQIPEMNLEQKLRTANRDAVTEALPKNAALVEFVRFSVFDFKAVPARGETRWKPARYVAFVLPAGEPDNVKLIELGEAEPIERMIAGFRASITGGERSLRPSEPLLSTRTNDGTDLRRAVFDPLVPALGGCTRLLLAPDGDLTRLPFEALPITTGRRLIDDYQLSYLTVGRDVLRFGAASSGQGEKPLVVADPDFNLGMAGAPIATSEARPSGRQSRALDPNAIRFAPLPGTHTEGEYIAARLGVQPWLKGTALEGPLKTSPSPHILHIATHGFFLEDQKRDPRMEQLCLGRLSHAMENPLLRSGLAMAGANSWLQKKPLPVEAEDGILNAEDVSGLNLLGTELVVLSACETGLGEIQEGEGVFGLRRAFVLAGANTLVMSLWKVPDQQTQELMEDFYQRILAGEGRAEALREAQLAIKAKYPDPLYWGAFICQGDPGPLQRKETG